MRWSQKLRLRLRSLFRSHSVEQELTEELQYHLERLIDDRIAAGASPDDARYAALREMGAMEAAKEECRDARGLRLIEAVGSDLRYSVRQLRKSRVHRGGCAHHRDRHRSERHDGDNHQQRVQTLASGRRRPIGRSGNDDVRQSQNLAARGISRSSRLQGLRNVLLGHGGLGPQPGGSDGGRKDRPINGYGRLRKLLFHAPTRSSGGTADSPF